MNTEQPVLLSDLVCCLSKAVDLVSPLVADHHRRVACMAGSMARAMELSAGKVRDLIIAAALHDIGGLSLAMRISAMRFETSDAQEHADLGYLLLKTFPPFTGAADIVRHHHLDWKQGAGSLSHGEQVPLESHIIHLADKVAVLMQTDEAVLTQAEKITDCILDHSGEMFPPDLAEVFHDLAARECFWLEALTSAWETNLTPVFGAEPLNLDEELFDLSRLFCRVIDFRSRFTASHTSAVASCAVALAELAGFSESDCRRMAIAGYIHDLGKLAVPAEILEKPAPLTREEFNIVRTHTFYTDHILKPLHGFDTIRKWGALHHERLDGRGYPFHLEGKDLSTGSRILSVADVFVALTENRPYRRGLKRHEVLPVLENMVRKTALDGGIVELLEDGFEKINATRIEAHYRAEEEYHRFARQAAMLRECSGQV